MRTFAKNSIIKFFFFGNYFYGICVIALSIEATLQQQLPLNNIYYFLAVFCLTVVYYTKAYITDKSGYPSDERNIWYIQHKTIVKRSQLFFSLITLVLIFLFTVYYWQAILNIFALKFFLFLIFPLIAALYYGVDSKFNLRKIGWLKPFIIGFTWAGIVTVYPALFYTVETQTEYQFTIIGSLLFLKNFMFISVLCIMFDIKDYAADAEQRLNTFVVRSGLKKTITLIIIPLCVAGLGTFVFYGITRHFHPIKIILNVLPFVLLLITAYSLNLRRSLLYYLIVVDGLMLVKAICGTVAMMYF